MGDVSINNLRVFAHKRAAIYIQKASRPSTFVLPKINKPILCFNGLFSVGPNKSVNPDFHGLFCYIPYLQIVFTQSFLHLIVLGNYLYKMNRLHYLLVTLKISVSIYFCFASS